MEKSWSYVDEKRFYVDILLAEVEKRYGKVTLWEKPRMHDSFRIEDAARETTCCFTGNRPEKLARDERLCKQLLMGAILDSYVTGYRVYISGMARGVDLWAAMAVLTMRCFYPDIRLVAACPFPSRSKHVMSEQMMILSEADDTRELSQAYWQGAYEMRNRWMVDHASRVIALMDQPKGGSGNTVRYAREMGANIILL